MKSIIEAKIIGGKQALKTAIVIFIIFEMVSLYYETSGNFANGILFFIEGQTNLIAVGHFLMYFGIMYFIGRQVGKAILIKRKIYYLVALASGVLSTIMFVFANLLLLLLFKNQDFYYNNNDIVSFAIRNFVILVLPIILIWFWIAFKIKGKEIFS